MKKIMILSIAIVILFAGCVDKSDNVQPVNKSDNVQPTLTPAPTDIDIDIEIEIPENAEKVVDLAKADLAKTLSTSTDNIKLSDLEEITWSDSSLGYQNPGEQYLPVETPGYIIFLLHNNKTYEYHSDYERIVPPPAEKKKGQ